MKIDRLLSIVLLLLNRKKMSAAELAERFGVSIRTIYRDIDAIDAAGIPIISYQGVGGGFGIIDSYKLDRQVLTPDDMLSILAALRGIGDALGDQRVVDSSEKIQSLIPRDLAHQLDDLFRVELVPWGASKTQLNPLRQLQIAVVERRLTQFTYLNTRGAKTVRTVEPMTLIFKGSAWYAFGYCRLRGDYRLFRLSRIRELSIQHEQFERRSGRYEEFARESWRKATQAEISVVLRFDAAVQFAVEDFFLPEEIEPTENGGRIVRFSMPDDQWLRGLILSYGQYVQVLEPLYLREQIKQQLKDALSQYR